MNAKIIVLALNRRLYWQNQNHFDLQFPIGDRARATIENCNINRRARAGGRPPRPRARDLGSVGELARAKFESAFRAWEKLGGQWKLD